MFLIFKESPKGFNVVRITPATGEEEAVHSGEFEMTQIKVSSGNEGLVVTATPKGNSMCFALALHTQKNFPDWNYFYKASNGTLSMALEIPANAEVEWYKTDTPLSFVNATSEVIEQLKWAVETGNLMGYSMGELSQTLQSLTGEGYETSEDEDEDDVCFDSLMES